MAASVLPPPGATYGPCEGSCAHSDCRASREMAESICPICKDRIGYKCRFYDDARHGLVHAICVEWQAP